MIRGAVEIVLHVRDTLARTSELITFTTLTTHTTTYEDRPVPEAPRLHLLRLQRLLDEHLRTRHLEQKPNHDPRRWHVVAELYMPSSSTGVW